MSSDREVYTVFHVYFKGKRVNNSPEIILTMPLTGKVTFPQINKKLDKLRNQAKKIIEEQYKDAYPVLQSYKRIVTDEEVTCYCWTCKSEFTDKRIYGILGQKSMCPQGHDKISTSNLGECSYCKNGKMWEKSVSYLGVECLVYNYVCVACGKKEHEPVD